MATTHREEPAPIGFTMGKVYQVLGRMGVTGFLVYEKQPIPLINKRGGKWIVDNADYLHLLKEE